MDPILQNGERLVGFIESATDKELELFLDAASFGTFGLQPYGNVDGLSAIKSPIFLTTQSTSIYTQIPKELHLTTTLLGDLKQVSVAGTHEEMPLAA
jgi:hypothetical protein